MKLMCSLLLSFLLLCISNIVPAQNHLVLKHNRRGELRIFYPGDLIRLQVKKNKQRYVGNIESVDDSMLVISQIVTYQSLDKVVNNSFREFIPLKDIAFVFAEPNKVWDAARYGFYAGTIMAGSSVIGLAVANSLILGSVPPIGLMVIVSGVLFSGLMLKYMGRNQYKVGKKWELAVVAPEIPVKP